MSEETNKYNRKFYIDLDTVAEERNEWFHGGGEEWYHAIKDGYNFGNLGKLGQGFHLYTDPNYILGEVGVVYLYSYMPDYAKCFKSVEELEEFGRMGVTKDQVTGWSSLREMIAFKAPLANARYVLSRYKRHPYVYIMPENEITEVLVYERRNLLFEDSKYNTHELNFTHSDYKTLGDHVRDVPRYS
tara:strand:+ start:749 stop:1309 length:561 start_codon:yes stop_codon:yes gene_type:complete